MLSVAGCGGDNPSNSGGDDGDPTQDTTPPASPSGLEGISGDETVELTWNANVEDDLAGYNIYRSESSFSDITDMNPVNESPITGTEFTDENLQNGTTYYYRLTAIDDSENESNTSGEIEVTPFSDPPDRPK